MRILIFTQQLAAFRSGVGTYAYGLITGLSALGHQITVVVPECEQIEMPAFRTLPVVKPLYDPTPGGWLSLGILFAKILKNEGRGYDIAHFTDAREAWRVGHPAIPVTGMVNDSYAIDWVKPGYPRGIFSDRWLRDLYYKLLRFVEKRSYPHLDAVIANSAYTARMITDGYGLDARNIHAIFYGLPEQSPALPVSLTGSPSVLFVGGNFQRKGLLILFKAVSRLLPEFPNICVHVIGNDRNQPYLAKEAHMLGIASTVKFHGWQPNDKVRGMMAGTDIFVLPSLSEGFGFVYLEAMRAGVPVIATSIGGAKETFIENKEALFAEPGDVRGLAAAIKKIISDSETASRLRKGGLAAVARFSVNRMAKETEGLFLKILKNNR